MPTAHDDGITIEYEDDGGPGEPMLLVMGLGRQLIDWPDGFLDELRAQGFRLIRHDNRDAGLSTLVDAPVLTKGDLARAAAARRLARSTYLVSDMAADAAAVLDELGIDRADVVGVSMGGMIAQQIAIDVPDRVRSLTSIMSSTGSRRVGQPTMAMRRHFLRARPTREAAADFEVDTFTRISGPHFDEKEIRAAAERSVARSFRPAGTVRQLVAVAASPDRTTELRGLDVPALVVHGMLDPLVKPSGGHATAEAIPGSQLLVFNDMGHDLPRPRWSEIATAIRANADR